MVRRLLQSGVCAPEQSEHKCYDDCCRGKSTPLPLLLPGERGSFFPLPVLLARLPPPFPIFPSPSSRPRFLSQRWSHACVTLGNRTQWRVYLNGALKSTITAPYVSHCTQASLHLRAIISPQTYETVDHTLPSTVCSVVGRTLHPSGASCVCTIKPLAAGKGVRADTWKLYHVCWRMQGQE